MKTHGRIVENARPALLNEIVRLRASHDRLLAAAKMALPAWRHIHGAPVPNEVRNILEAAIAAAEARCNDPSDETIDRLPNIRRLRASHDRLLAAAKEVLPIVASSKDFFAWEKLKAAITVAPRSKGCHDA